MKKFYGFLELKDGGKQAYFDEIAIEAKDYREGRKAFHYWLMKKAIELKDYDGYDDHAEFMAIELAPKRAKNLKPKKAEEIISEVLGMLRSS